MRALLLAALLVSTSCGVPSTAPPAAAPPPAKGSPAPAAAAGPAAARCVVTVDAPTPMRLGPALAARRLERDMGDTSDEPLAFRDEEGLGLLADPRELSRALPRGKDNAHERWTPARRFALGYDRALRVALRNETDYALVGGGQGALDWLFFATDTPGGGARLVGANRGKDGEPHLVVLTLDAKMSVTAMKELERLMPPVSVAVARDGALVVVYLQRGRGEGTSTVRLAAMDALGSVVPSRSVAEGVILEAAVALDAGTPVVAYAMLRPDERKKEEIPVDLRVVRVPPGGEPTPLWSLRAKTYAWNVAGSAGGILPLALQAASLGEHAVFAWVDFGERDAGLRFGAARGGPSAQRVATPEGWALLQGAADGLGTVLLLHRQDQAHQAAALRCAP
jgi:hypothetical protein